MDINKLKSKFPNETLPDKLNQLALYQERIKREDYSGEFLIDENADEYFENRPFKENFAPFATDYSGSVFAFWSGKEEKLSFDNINNSPIVFLSSECVYTTLLAKDFESFLSLLLLGNANLGVCAAKDEELFTKEKSEALTHFQTWSFDTFGIKVPENPNQIVSEAKVLFGKEIIKWYQNCYGQDQKPWTKFPF